MTTQIWWFLSRGSGIVAWTMLGTTCLLGIAMSTPRMRLARPVWLLDLHRWVGSLAVITTGLHLTGLVADSYVHFGWSEILLPQASAWKRSAVTWGVIAFYLMVVIQLTSWTMKHLPRRLWHAIHLFSYVLFGCATVHGALAGTDRGNRLYIGGVALGISLVTLGLFVRIARRRARASVVAAPAAVGLAAGDVLLGGDPALDGATGRAGGTPHARHSRRGIDHHGQPAERVRAVAPLGSLVRRDDA
ncbi:MAG: Ferric reductase like transrane component [Ilumatobacteraceae bacterium]|nr:Ferric reductase like transrane component [Ilumatobacteraceae bacterium]